MSNDAIKDEAKSGARSSYRVTKRETSPLRKGETVTVLAMAAEAECEHEMFVRIRWQGRLFGVPLAQLKGKQVDARTRQAVDDWHYWVSQGYIF